MNIRTILATVLLVTKTVMYAGNPIGSPVFEAPNANINASPVMRPRSISPMVLLRVQENPNREIEGTRVFPQNRNRSMSQGVIPRPVSPSTFDSTLSVVSLNDLDTKEENK